MPPKITNGAQRDVVQAYAWLNLAAAQGNQNAAKGRSIVQKHMTPAQFAEGQNLSRELFERLKK